MPAGESLGTLPEPLDPRIQFKPQPAARHGVIRYTGPWSDSNYDEHGRRLQQAISAAGLPITGRPVYSRYDPPWIPWFLRRNEIGLPLD